MLEKIEGVVIRTRDYGETNKIVTLFTERYGIISGVARGAKKPKSRMAAVTQPFIYGVFLMRVSTGLGTIQQAEVINSMRKIREDIIKTAYATYICELIAKILNEKEPYRPLYQEFLASLEKMADEELSPEIVAMMLEMKLYRIGGFAPVLHECINGHVDEPIVAFSVSEGGVLCKQCQYSSRDAVKLPVQIHKLLVAMSQTSINRIRNVDLKKETIQWLRKMLDDYYDRFGGMSIKSKRFLEQIHLLDD